MALRLEFRDPQIFTQLKASTAALHTVWPTVGGGERTVLYADNAASTQRLVTVTGQARRFGAYYANPHALTHGPARVSTEAVARAHEIAARFAGANPETHETLFMGDGTTDTTNWVALMLKYNPLGGGEVGRDSVIIDGKGHHAAITPFLHHLGPDRVIGVPFEDAERGQINVQGIADALKRNPGKIRLVVISGADNLMGIISPIREVADLAHQHGALLFVDAAHLFGHALGATIEPYGFMGMEALGIDILGTSPHKFYAPGADGLVIAPKTFLQGMPARVGGGHVKTVMLTGFTLVDVLPKRHEAGTANVFGAILSGVALETLSTIGMQRVWEHERRIVQRVITGLSAIEGVTMMGDLDTTRTPRTSVVSFTIEGLHHATAGAALFDYRATAVRTGCHCAQPAGATLLRIDRAALEAYGAEINAGDKSRVPGLVRGSFGVYTTDEDADRFVEDVAWVAERRGRLVEEYEPLPNGSARRLDGWTERMQERERKFDPFDFVTDGAYTTSL